MINLITFALSALLLILIIDIHQKIKKLAKGNKQVIKIDHSGKQINTFENKLSYRDIYVVKNELTGKYECLSYNSAKLYEANSWDDMINWIIENKPEIKTN